MKVDDTQRGGMAISLEYDEALRWGSSRDGMWSPVLMVYVRTDSGQG